MFGIDTLLNKRYKEVEIIGRGYQGVVICVTDISENQEK